MSLAVAGVLLLVAFAVLGALAVLLRVPKHWLSAVVLFVIGAGMLLGAVLA